MKHEIESLYRKLHQVPDGEPVRLRVYPSACDTHTAIIAWDKGFCPTTAVASTESGALDALRLIVVEKIGAYAIQLMEIYRKEMGESLVDDIEYSEKILRIYRVVHPESTFVPVMCTYKENHQYSVDVRENNKVYYARSGKTVKEATRSLYEEMKDLLVERKKRLTEEIEALEKSIE